MTARRRPDEGRYSKVSRRIWGSADFRELSAPKPNAQTLWFRLLTGPELGVVPGLFEWSEAGTAERLGWSVPALRKCLKEITDRGMAVFDKAAGVMWVPKGIRHNPPDNPNVVLGWKAAWREIPECDVKLAAQDALTLWCVERGKAWLDEWAKVMGDLWVESIERVGGNPLPAESPQPSGKQEKEQEQEKDPPSPPPPPDPFLGSFLPVREDVRELHERWKSTTGLVAHRLKGPSDLDAVTLAEALDGHGKPACFAVLGVAMDDGMVNGTADDKRQPHTSIRYIFGNSQTFARLEKAARDKARRARPSDVVQRAAAAEPDLTDYRDPECA